jgi:hypothetical protein
MKLGEATIEIKTAGMDEVKKDLDILAKKLEKIKELLIEINSLFGGMKNINTKNIYIESKKK